MTTSGAGPVLVLVLAVGVLVGCGVILLLERSLTRILLGVILIGNGVNLLILLGGRSGGAPIVGTGPVDRMSDPLAQAMVLTSIVITFGLTAFLLAVAYRSWFLTGDDEVPDDLEDRQIISQAERNEVGTADRGGEGPNGDPEQVDPEPARRRLRRGDEA
ncbi:multisubunit sodium/proton antiporter, MrpC subunit [Micromonospora coriariae]|uniref:Multisubunit sodium/proton antiporter, MrpC subunit n=1 Tax=Micromonospora coriariae TaxID=285665 RepID=A0A1C4UT65_9ACTN|nr:Na(+)/H(+) antiporter subunit C [Micromonospora coriariae]SCE74805.1 multisubunit sodium/proton antiporter, MrpC subunit [Micromonospora coriariae]